MKKVLYIGGFQLPDKNAAALRVLSNAKAMQKIGFEVIFLNSLVKSDLKHCIKVEYEGFRCLEYKRESQIKYLLKCKKIISVIEKFRVDIVIAYNYPAIALMCLKSYCKRNNIKCYADVTEWYVPKGNLIFKIVKGIDSELRMRYIHPRLDGVIAISEYLYSYYRGKVKTIKIPPLVDICEKKWQVDIKKNEKGTKLIYAGSPYAQKERLDIIIRTLENSKNCNNLHLDIIGITEKQYNKLYDQKYSGHCVSFLGCLPNNEVIKMIKNANWSIIMRDNNKVVKAGFPTKISESISCGTPVISNKFSNIEDYLNSENSILINTYKDLEQVFENINGQNKKVDETIFDYNKYIELFRSFFE